MPTVNKKSKCLGIVAGLVLFSGLVIPGCAWTNGMIFHPPPCSYRAGDVDLVRSKNEVVAVKHLENSKATYTILYSHGNAEDLGHTLPLMRAFRDAGFSVVTYDYLGYGLSRDYNGAGPTERGAYRAASRAYWFATEKLGVPANRLIIVGRSVGSGPATYLADTNEVAGLVLISPFVSAYRVVTKYPIIPFDKFKNLSRIDNVDEPLFVVHGLNDQVIPIWHGKKIYRAAEGDKRALWIEDAGHNDLFHRHGRQILRAIAKFRDELSTGTLKPRRSRR